jgi:elongation factor G
MFFNKLDRPGASFRSSLLSLLSNRLHPKPMTLTLPIASFFPGNYSRAEPGIEGLVDLVKWEVWRWDSDGATTRYNLPRTEQELKQTDIFSESHPIIPHLIPARMAFLENLSMFSEELMEQLLEMNSSPSHYLSMNSSSILPHLRKATLNDDILPVLCGSAMKNVGTELVMDYVGELLANPLDVSLNDGSTNNLLMLAWKVSWDKRKGWMTFVRVYSGAPISCSTLVFLIHL